MSDWASDYLEAKLAEEEAAEWEPQQYTAEEIAELLAALPRREVR